MKKEFIGRESLVSTVVSVAAPLIQLLAVLSISLTDQLKLSKFFAKSEYLPLVNFFTIFIVLSVIGVLVTKKNIVIGESKKPSLVNKLFNKFFKLPEPQSHWEDESRKQVQLMNRALWFFQIPSLLFFLASILITFKKFPIDYLAFFQYLFYIAFVVSSGIITFLWLQYYQQTKDRSKPEDFQPNLLNALRTHGLLKENRVTVLNKKANSNMDQIIRLKIETETYIVITDYSGEQILDSWEEGKAPDEIKKYVDDAAEYIK